MTMLTRIRFFVAAMAVLATPACAKPRTFGGSPIPAQAAAKGFLTKTFETAAFGAATVDTGATNASGYQWYLAKSPGVPSSSSMTWAQAHGSFGSDGSITVNDTSNGSMISGNATPGVGPGYVGTAFGGGGYFEAEVSFCQRCVDTGSGGWPSWWMMSAEHWWQWGAMTWPGQGSSYEHFGEIDVFEALRPRIEANHYAASLHDWYGQWNVTCPGRLCAVDTPYSANTVIAPVGTDWSLFHRIGMRWVMATAGTPGEITFWLDDVPVGTAFTWSKCPPSGWSPPPADPYKFCIFDQQHMLLLFGAGGSTPITVRRVTVWQTDASANVHN
ncbi:MAG: hypothetical protein KGN34_02810 [Sphingomonadales bacterium]|nr:hypothetical protein [Sphingomonadales bacterium]